MSELLEKAIKAKEASYGMALLTREQKDAAQMMKFSQSARLFMQFAFAAVGVLLFNAIIPSIVPLFFPRVAIAFRPYIGKKTDSKVEE